MPTWNYEAHSKFGEPSTGTVEAATEQEAAEKLRKDGLFAREITQDKIKPKYDRGALTTDVPDAPPAPEDGKVDSEGKSVMVPPPEPTDMACGHEPPLPSLVAEPARADINVPLGDIVGDQQDDPIRRQAPQTSGAADHLARELESISRVIRIMDAWAKAYSETKNGEDLPPGVPSVGGQTWDMYKGRRQTYVDDMLLEALKRAARQLR